MAIAPVSSPVVAGNTALASEINNIQLDASRAVGHRIGKAADESVASSTTLQNDDDFVFAIAANEIWVVNLYLHVSVPNAPDMKMEWSLPSGGVKMQTAIMYDAISGVLDSVTKATGVVTLVSGATGTYIFATATLTNGSTAGNAQLQWAQNASSASAVVFEEESWMQALLIL